MAQKKLTKWIVGAATVAAFTGFIGSINQLDGTKESATGTANDKWDQATAAVEEDQVKQEWLDSTYYEEYEDDDDDEDKYTKHSRKYFDDSYGQTSQQPQLRTRAS